MTIWYFDSVNGSDGKDGKSVDNAKASYEAFVLAGFPGAAQGDTYLFKRGTTQVITAANVNAGAGNSGARTKYGAYGVAQVPYSIWTPPPTGTLNNAYILNVSGRSYTDFEDMYFDGLNRATYTLYLFASGATANVSHTIRRCYFTNTAPSALSIPNGSGLIFGGTDTSTGDTSDYLFEDCQFFNNPVHGMIVNGAHGVIIRRCQFYNNGFNAPSGGHGFSSKYRLREFTPSGWVQSGTVWSYTLQSYEVDVYYVKTNVTNYGRLVKNTSTPTTPNVGEFGVSGGKLYINVGSTNNPSTQAVQYAWGRCYDITVEDCISFANVNDPNSPFVEGHGFAFDNWVDDSTFRRNRSYGNDGAGFSINMGDRNVLEANIAYDNLAGGIICASAQSTIIRKNTCFNNNKGVKGIKSEGEITLFPNCKNGEIKNNILTKRGSPDYGLNIFPDVTGVVIDTNCIYGYSVQDRSNTAVNTKLVDPGLAEDFRPTHPDVIRTGLNLGGADCYNKMYYSSPNIGAVEDYRIPSWVAVSK